MKKKKNIALIILIGTIFVLAAGMIIFRLLQDENALTVTEKKYITENKSNLISINILNNSNVFGSAGEGVFYDFLEDFEKEKGLTFNVVTTSIDSTINGLSLTKGSTLPENAELFYTDHYVLVGKTHNNFANIESIEGTIGILTKDFDVIRPHIEKYSKTITNYDSKDELINALGADEVNYIIVPMVEYLDNILSNLYFIDFHFSDIKDYYFMINSDNKILSSILSKHYNVWIKDKFSESFDKNEYNLFTNKLKITEKELDVIDSKEYIYGFVPNVPYDVRTGGAHGGIASTYLKAFSRFSGITIEYKEYSRFDKFVNAISREKVDLFLNFYNVNQNYTPIDSLHTMDISFIMNNEDTRVFTTLDSIKKETIYVKENSLIINYLNSNNIKTETYKNDKDIKKLLKQNKIVALDKMNYLMYKDENKNINERFSVNTSLTYNFMSKNDTMFNRLFSYYISTLDKNELLYRGIDNYNKTIKSGTIIYKITKYAFALIIIISAVTLIVYKFGKKIHINKKIKRADKIKYIDMLTSLKNRNFLNENLSIWNQNTIYPQAVIVIDLNSLQDLNDIYGYQEGDKQIQAAANVLIKTQLDNSEIMRTDGNEFTIYMIGYSERQVLSYIKKLNKEFKNLPHDKGAAIGFSMIEDDLKLIDDAINEATERMRENKELAQGESSDEKI